ncbi:hypothetical protein D3C78_1951330 [compost metagenome]
MLVGKVAGGGDQAIQGGGLVVAEVGENGYEGAFAVEERGVPRQRVADLRPHDALIIADGVPLRASLEAT